MNETSRAGLTACDLPTTTIKRVEEAEEGETVAFFENITQKVLIFVSDRVLGGG